MKADTEVREYVHLPLNPDGLSQWLFNELMYFVDRSRDRVGMLCRQLASTADAKYLEASIQLQDVKSFLVDGCFV